MRILGIETSCDETAVAIVENGVTLLSSSIASSMKIHEQTGGIIPEQAARKQIEYMLPVLEDSLTQAFPHHSDQESRISEIDALAVTIGPGLIGSLLVGVETAKVLGTLWDKPVIPVNHVRAHLYANWVSTKTPPLFPLLALVVSGGHTDLVYLKSHTDITLIGATRDDAAGEAFDKCARLLKLGYPGGPAISMAADKYRADNPSSTYTLFPRGLAHDDTFDFSFSGLKTSVLRYVQSQTAPLNTGLLAVEIEEAIVDALLNKVIKAMSQHEMSSFLLSGGVSANSRLRQKTLAVLSEKNSKLQVYVPEKSMSTDNAAMIASHAYFHSTPMKVFEVAPIPDLAIA